MLILDTNILSEAMRPTPNDAFARWMQRESAGDHYATAVSEAELMQGIQQLPDGRRKNDLGLAARRILALIDGRILPFDRAAAVEFAEIVTSRRQLGRPIGILDAQIAAIARARSMAIATRDVADFADTGVTIINPWGS
jgi:toxin FitB